MTMRLRPLRLAWYMARSAWCSSSLTSAVCSVAGDPQTDGDGQFVALEPERMADTANQAIEHGADVPLPLAVVQIDDEFVPSSLATMSFCRMQPCGLLPSSCSSLIAGTVAQGVIDLEVIIDENQG